MPAEQAGDGIGRTVADSPFLTGQRSRVNNLGRVIQQRQEVAYAICGGQHAKHDQRLFSLGGGSLFVTGRNQEMLVESIRVDLVQRLNGSRRIVGYDKPEHFLLSRLIAEVAQRFNQRVLQIQITGFFGSWPRRNHDSHIAQSITAEAHSPC